MKQRRNRVLFGVVGGALVAICICCSIIGIFSDTQEGDEPGALPAEQLAPEATQAEEEATAEDTAEPTNTIRPTNTIEPTDTRRPPTNTPRPTNTAVPATNTAIPPTFTAVPATLPPATVTTAPLPTQPLPTQPPAAVCDCSGDTRNCTGDTGFSSQAAAQACYNYCFSIVGYDIHQLDGNDNDGLACESLN